MNFPNDILPAYAIWLNGDNNKDEYADFYPNVDFVEGKEYLLRIVCDTDRSVYLDGKLISFGQYADYPRTPAYEDIRFTAHSGSILKITAWHSGIDSQTHMATDAYIAFSIYSDGDLIYSSSKSTPVRPTPEYIPYKCKIITSQMGAGFAMNGQTKPGALHDSSERNIEIDSLKERPILPLVLGESITGYLIRKGSYRLTEKGDSAEMMKKAELDVSEDAEGVYFLFDLGKECVGFPEISFDSKEECDVMIGWGEHISDGMCRTAIHSRRFSTDIKARPGGNHYFPVLRRLGLRYLQVFFSSREIENLKIEFHPVILPAEVVKLDLNNETRKNIREAAIHTLLCCMHEHYEDCPWREQALYTLDSRNQMLAGYKVFAGKNAAYARANLDLITRGVRKDGILSLCYPAGLDYPIPFYTLAFFMQMEEYIENTADTSLAEEKIDFLKALLQVFYDRLDTNGLIRRFPDSEGYWNFYEWSDHLSGDRIHKKTEHGDLPYEAILNAALSIASRSMSRICTSIGRGPDAKYYAQTASEISEAVSEVFYDTETELFFDFTDRPSLQRSVLTQAMCILCGAADGLNTHNMLETIENNGGFGAVPATLSMACFRYDALLRINREKYAQAIINEIDRDGKYMLDRRATTFWETLKGDTDFGGAGSLCHGWSAMAAYYYSVLL